MKKLLLLASSCLLVLAFMTPAQALLRPKIIAKWREDNTLVVRGKNLTGRHLLQTCNNAVYDDGLAACGGVNYILVDGDFRLRWYPEVGPVGNGVCDGTHPCLIGLFPVDENNEPIFEGALFAYMG